MKYRDRFLAADRDVARAILSISMKKLTAVVSVIADTYKSAMMVTGTGWSGSFVPAVPPVFTQA